MRPSAPSRSSKHAHRSGSRDPSVLDSWLSLRSLPCKPNPTGDRARLRDNWQEIGTNRFVQAGQNALIHSMSYFSYPAAFTMGNVGRNTFDRQRSIDTQFAFQNPFKWYNLSAPNTSVNFTTGTSDEGTTANAGGQGLRNITLQFRF